MKCKKIQQNIVLEIYGELKENEKAELKQHIAECSVCAKDYAYSKSVFEALEEADIDDIPEPQWSASWAHINTAIKDKPSSRRLFSAIPNWAYAVAGVMFVFFLGIFAGRFWLPTAQEGLQVAATSQDDYRQTLNNHLDELKPVLLQIANYSAEENGNSTVTMDRQALQSLIIQNILLKSLITEQNPTAKQILEDAELVLRELANMDEGDSRTKPMLKELIDERGILLNMNILQKM